MMEPETQSNEEKGPPIESPIGSPIKLRINLRKKKVAISPSSISSPNELQKTKLTRNVRTKPRVGLKPKRSRKTSVPIVDTPDMSVGRIEEGRYEIESIQDHREVKSSGKIDYFVKWVGWESCHNTWEPAEHMDGCENILQDYYQLLREKEAKKPVKKRAKQDDSSFSLNDSGIGLDEEGVDTNEENLQQAVSDEQNEEEGLTFDRIRVDVPKGKKPLRLIHVTHVDGKLVYIVEHEAKNGKPENNTWNGEPKIFDLKTIDLYIGKAFKLMYPQMVIEFYQSRIKPLQSNSAEEVARKAAEDVVIELVRQSQDNSVSDEEEGNDM